MTAETVSWIASAALDGGPLRIALTVSDGTRSEITWLTDSVHNDYKPVLNPAGSRVAFFRTWTEAPSFYDWRSAICVMDIDGGNLRELTDHEFMNTEPYWTRDGSERITWSRMLGEARGGPGTGAFSTHADASPGDEIRLSGSLREWSNSNLQDGRLFVKRGNGYYLMTPGVEPRYEAIDIPGDYHYLHKLTISDDERRVAYMKHVDTTHDEYRGAEIVYADFDATGPAIRNEVAFVPQDASTFSWYVAIAPGNERLLYAEDGRIMEYDVHAATTRQLSTQPRVQYRYPTYVGTVK